MDMNSANQTLSVLFAGVSGSARLHEKLGSDEAARAVDRCLKRMERAIGAYGGRIIKRVGDELMVVFNLADEAFQAAIEMQQRVADLPPVSGVKLAIRLGLAYGSVDENDGSLASETVKDAAGLAGLAKPGQVLASLQAQAALSPALKSSTRDLGPPATKGKSPKGIVFEVVAPDTSLAEPGGAGDHRESKSSSLQGARLQLRYAGKLITLDDGNPVITMGRDKESDVVIHDRRASRNHARIELQGDRIVLIDNSTNGTFVTLNGNPELFLRKEECLIHAKGLICFADSAASPGADCAEFDLI